MRKRRRPGMNLLLLPVLSVVLTLASPRAEKITHPQSAISKIENYSNIRSRPGYYLEIKRSYLRAYSGWQRKTIALLRSRHFSAFTGQPQNMTTVDGVMTTESLVSTTKALNTTSSVFVGPYSTKADADERISEVLAALRPLIKKEKQRDQLQNRYLFLVGVVRVK